MWRKVVTQQRAELPAQRAALPPVERPTQPQDLAQLLLPRQRRARPLHSLFSFWAPTSPGSTTRAASFFQHVSATTWLRAS
jgi:hypothetical protein